MAGHFYLDWILSFELREDMEFFPIRRARADKIGYVCFAFECNGVFQVDLVGPEFSDK